MPPIATPKQPRLGHLFLIEVEGVDAGTVETFQPPTETSEEVMRASGGMQHNVGFTSGYSIEDITLGKVMPINAEDNWAYDWMRTQVNPLENILGLAADYKKRVSFHHLGADGEILETWTYEGCRIKQVAMTEHNATEKTTKVIETVTIGVDYMVKGA